MTIISTLPFPNLANGAEADATQVDADFAAIVSNVNSNAQPLSSSITGSTYKGAFVQAGSGTTATATPTAFIFSTATIDTNSFWSSGSPTRLTIPTGVSLIRLTAQIFIPSGSTEVTATFGQNGSVGVGGEIYIKQYSGDNFACSLLSYPLSCVATDYFELYFQAGTGSVILPSFNWLEMSVLK